MTNRELDQQMATQVSIERRASKEILKLIVQAKTQNLCGELGFKDLADWLIRGHNMSERTAYRKLKAARLSSSVPSVLEKIEQGALSITKASQVQSAIQAHEKFTGEKLSQETKSEIIERVEKLGACDTERTLISFFPETASEVKQTRTSVVTQDISRLSINLPNETLDLIKRAAQLLSHSIPNGSQAEVIRQVFDDFLDRKDPLRKPKASGDPVSTQSAAGARRNKAAIRRETIQNAKASCEFVDHKTGRVCGSTYQLQIDHIRPKAIGGTDEPENLRCLCRRHNLYMAEKNLGNTENWRQRQ